MMKRNAGSGYGAARSRDLLKNTVCVAVFAALAYAVTFVFRLPVSFLTFDAKDAVITVAAMYFGPLAAGAMALIAALLELVTVSGTGLYGFVMNFVSSFAFAGMASLIYRWRRTAAGSVIGVISGTVGMTGIMLLMNLWITPLYMGAPREAVIALIPTLLLPFNLLKGMLNAALTLFLYKPFSTALKAAGFHPTGRATNRPTPPPVLATAEENPDETAPARREKDPGADGFRPRRTAVLMALAFVMLAIGIVGILLLKARSGS